MKFAGTRLHEFEMGLEEILLRKVYNECVHKLLRVAKVCEILHIKLLPKNFTFKGKYHTVAKDQVFYKAS